MADTAWNELVEAFKEVSTLNQVRSLLGWDQQTYMPDGGAAGRGEQLAVLARLVHERVTDPRIGDLLAAVEAADSPPEEAKLRAASVRNLTRGVNRATRVSADLVARMSRAHSDGFSAWVKAKNENDYAAFQPHLQTIVDLARERAAAIDSSSSAYDVLLDEFEPGCTTASLLPMFERLSAGLGELISAVGECPQNPKFESVFDVQRQRVLHQEVAEKLGFDPHIGRLDLAEHPFTTGLGPGDIRITTHLYDGDLLGGLSGTTHEAGHAMYEQGLPVKWIGTGVEDAASFGLHESQSRFWENTIGGSLPFMRWFHGRLLKHFPGTRTTAQDMYKSYNRVQPGLIRVFADEVTYNLHIIVRFELEQAIIGGSLTVADLPDAWNAAYEKHLGITPPNDGDGVLQDVHWSTGAFGYFPSYTLGNLYAASLGAGIRAAVPDLWEQVERGEFGSVLQWLRHNVHEKGHLADAPEIVSDAVGERDNVEDLLSYLWARHGAIYGVSRPQ